MRGIIVTWSINWDMGTNSGGQQYDEQFVKDYGPYVHGQTPPPTDGDLLLVVLVMIVLHLVVATTKWQA